MTINTVSHSDLLSASASDVRAAIRDRSYQGHTAGLASGKLQCNLAILTEQDALDFLRFCLHNPKPCPLVGVSDSGDPKLPTLGRDIDIRTDVSKYRIFRDGQFSEEVTDISDHWSGDLVTVALGCSFTFENALLRSGIPVRHVETGKNVPMFRSNIDLVPAGKFSGQMVVTMRPIPEQQVAQAKEISSRFPQAHGAPIAVGDPAQIGIADLGTPDWGDAVEVKPGEVPVYWACGVTPQNVLLDAGLPLCITHSPGHMLIADVAEDAETTILDMDTYLLERGHSQPEAQIQVCPRSLSSQLSGYRACSECPESELRPQHRVGSVNGRKGPSVPKGLWLFALTKGPRLPDHSNTSRQECFG